MTTTFSDYMGHTWKDEVERYVRSLQANVANHEQLIHETIEKVADHEAELELACSVSGEITNIVTKLGPLVDSHESELDKVLDAILYLSARIDALEEPEVDENFVQLTITAAEAERLKSLLFYVEEVGPDSLYGVLLAAIGCGHASGEVHTAFSRATTPPRVRLID